MNEPLPLLLHLKNFLMLFPFSISSLYLFSPSTLLYLSIFHMPLTFHFNSPKPAFTILFFHPLFVQSNYSTYFFHSCFPYLLSFLRFTLLYFIFLGIFMPSFLILPTNVFCPVLLCSFFTLISSHSILLLLSLLSFHNLLPFLRPLLVYGPHTKLNPIH